MMVVGAGSGLCVVGRPMVGGGGGLTAPPPNEMLSACLPIAAIESRHPYLKAREVLLDRPLHHRLLQLSH
jgi:hypothetical protein